MTDYLGLAPKRLKRERDNQSKYSAITTTTLPLGVLALATVLCKVSIDPASIGEAGVLGCCFGIALPLIIAGTIGIQRNIKYQQKILRLEQSVADVGADWTLDMEALKLQNISLPASEMVFLDYANLSLLGKLVGLHRHLVTRFHL